MARLQFSKEHYVLLEAMGNEDAGWAEEANQSKSLTGFRSGTDQGRSAMVRSLVIGKGTRLLGRDTEPGFTLAAFLAR
jgi:hypothetical protein